jgi:amidase
VFGIRTSHGAIATDGVAALARSFDAVGWFARDADLMKRIGEVLLPPAARFAPTRLLIAADAFAASPVAAVLADGVAVVRAAFAAVTEVSVYDDAPSDVADAFRILQGAEIAAEHGGWIERYDPDFGPGVRERFAWTRTISPEQLASANAARERIASRVDALLGDDALLVLPTTPGIAPLLRTSADALEAFRARALALLSVAGLGGLPQVSLPLGTFDGCPVGLSLIAPRGRDRGLLQWIAGHFA